MGMTMLKIQADKISKIRDWERSQPEYTKETGDFIFFESPENGFDYGTKERPDVEMEIYECNQNKAYRRGTLLITPQGRTINRSYLELPDFNS